MNVKDLFSPVEVEIQAQIPEIEISSVTCDSRRCLPGSVFFAFQGTHDDGSHYVRDAVARGASVIVTGTDSNIAADVPVIRVKDARTSYSMCCRKFYTTDLSLPYLIGVTGTNGKSSVCCMIQHLLGGSKVCGLIGTIRNSGGGVDLKSDHTTPQPEVLFELIAKMSRGGVRSIVMEVSSHALDQNRILGLEFDAVIFTNITHDHLDYHGNFESYLKAKMKLLNHLKKTGKIIINQEDPRIQKAFTDVQESNLIRVGSTPEADFRITGESGDIEKSRYTLLRDGKRITVDCPMPGRHNALNSAMAVVCASEFGISASEMTERMSAFSGVEGRMEQIRAGQGFRIFIDYAHTDDGLQNVLQALKPLVKGKLLVLFGCGGDRDREKRPKMAAVAQTFSDYIILTSDNPRTEPVMKIIREIESGFSDDFCNYDVQADRSRAIRTILLKAAKNDVVLIAGKGHEDYQVIGKEKLNFSDREECLKILQGN